jgi:hypothetical protein
MKITIKQQDGQSYLDLDDFKNIIDISQVEYYTLEDLGNGSFAVTFYDKDKNMINLR